MSTLHITARFDVESQSVSLDPDMVTLTDEVDQVLWEFQGLPPGASPVILFPEGGGNGPFLNLKEGDTEVSGLGNHGRGTTDFYPYIAEVRTAGLAVEAGSGLILNAVTKPTGPENQGAGGPGCQWPNCQ